MIIICEIDITDRPAGKTESAPGAAPTGLNLTADAPAPLKCHVICPSTDGTHLVMVWEADSLEAVRQFLESKLGAAGRAKCFAVDQANATGLDALINKPEANSQADRPAESEAMAQLKQAVGPTTSSVAYQELVAQTQDLEPPTEDDSQAKHRRKRPKMAILLCGLISCLTLWLLVNELIQFTKGGQAVRVWLIDRRLPITPEVIDIYEVQLRPKWSFRLANLYSERGEYSYELQLDGKVVAIYRVGLKRRKQGESVFLIEARDALRDRAMIIPQGLKEE